MSKLNQSTSERILWALVAAMSIVIAGVVVALVLSITDKVDRVPQIARVVAVQVAHDESHGSLHDTELQACYRGNSLRSSLNLQGVHIYAAFSAIAELETETSNTASSGSITNRSAYQRRVQIEQTAAKLVQTAASNMQYLPLTNCAQAVENSTYKPKTPISWAQHLANEKKP